MDEKMGIGNEGGMSAMSGMMDEMMAQMDVLMSKMAEMKKMMVGEDEAEQEKNIRGSTTMGDLEKNSSRVSMEEE